MNLYNVKGIGFFCVSKWGEGVSDIIISGYYGLGNSGDEALLKSIVDDLKSINPAITITALSANTHLTNKLYGIKTIGRYNIFKIIKEFYGTKLLLSGGGTLIQDATSTKSLLYYLGIIFLAKKMGLKVMVYANGMGPIKEKNVKLVRRVVDKVDLITLRENESLSEIKRCNITKPKVIVTADPAFNLVASDKECADGILEKYGILPDEKLIAVSVRRTKSLPDNFICEMAKALDDVSKMGYLPIFIPMQTSLDFDISVEVKKKMNQRAYVIDCEMNVSDMLSVIGRCSMACGMRLHMLIFASVMNVPMAGIVYDPKIRGFMEYMNQKNFIELDKFEAEQFSSLMFDCINNLDSVREKLKNDSVVLREKAKKNAHLAMELLKD